LAKSRKKIPERENYGTAAWLEAQTGYTNERKAKQP